MGVSVDSLEAVSTLSAIDLIASKSGLIVLGSCAVSLTNDIVATWSVLEKSQKPLLGIVLVDSAI
jgi:hypothetical protein